MYLGTPLRPVCIVYMFEEEHRLLFVSFLCQYVAYLGPGVV